MKRSLLRFVMTTAVIVPLAACGSNKKRDEVIVPPPTSTPAPPPPVGTASLESLGATFAGLFRAGNDTEPRDPAEGDLPPISFTTEPVDITGA